MTFTSITPSDFQLRATHSSRLADLLAHRLEVARSYHNDSLVTLLEQEYQQLMTDSQPEQCQAKTGKTIATWWNGVWNNFADTIPGLYQLQIRESIDSQGQAVWQVYYPKTGQAFSASSRTELQAWVKDHYWAA